MKIDIYVLTIAPIPTSQQFGLRPQDLEPALSFICVSVVIEVIVVAVAMLVLRRLRSSIGIGIGGGGVVLI